MPSVKMKLPKEDEGPQCEDVKKSDSTATPRSQEHTPRSPAKSDDGMVIATAALLAAVQELCDAVSQEKIDKEALQPLSQRALGLAENAHSLAGETRKRQTLSQFASMIGEEVVATAQEYKDEGVRQANEQLRKVRSRIEEHFDIDEAFRMLGPLVHDANFARDVHDWANLVTLVPVMVLNLLNFTCSEPFLCGIPAGKATLASLWTGQYWEIFWWTTFAYFIFDLLFVLLLPHCVRSPTVIIVHHVVTMLYIMVPRRLPHVSWLMGCCMTVEVNTWFLIARRSFNKDGQKAFQPGVSMLKSLRLMSVSVCFYVSWFAIRIFFYPYLGVEIVREWYNIWTNVGTPFNIMLISIIIQVTLCCLNFKWTVDLIRSKLKGARGKSKGL